MNRIVINTLIIFAISTAGCKNVTLEKNKIKIEDFVGGIWKYDNPYQGIKTYVVVKESDFLVYAYENDESLVAKKPKSKITFHKLGDYIFVCFKNIDQEPYILLLTDYNKDRIVLRNFSVKNSAIDSALENDIGQEVVEYLFTKAVKEYGVVLQEEEHLLLKVHY